MPETITRSERARLFPILSEKSIEGRTLSVFLSTLTHVRPLAAALLAPLGQRIGTTARLRAYTEVSFKVEKGESRDRPDGLIVIDVGKRRWTALVEAKVRKNELNDDQLGRYLAVAKANKIDAVITISNQFSAVPHHHPVSVNAPKGVELFHFSWMHILTEAQLLVMNEAVDDADQLYVLREFIRFISHDSAGVQSYTQMPAAWSDICNAVQAGAAMQRGDVVTDVVEAWQQECRDLSLILSRQLGTPVNQKLTRAEIKNPEIRVKNDGVELCNDHRLKVTLEVPDAASPVNICADLRRRTIQVSMSLTAPGDKKSNRARMNWLLRQMPSDDIASLYVRAQWPGSSPPTQQSLVALFNEPDLIAEGKEKMTLTGFEILHICDLGGRFAQRRTFIDELEMAVPAFYEHVGQHLKAWAKPAPKLEQSRAEPDSVSPSALSEDDRDM
ncbi:hypothetical protein KCG44_01965 [Pacificimonas sp. WHA3]|uniref:Stress response protein n=1 Tax=Pacificimonas pallii TaxID=2827236 RepID=A0ABS6SAV7_9SPHN|nr:hypothetical protein [Pacificimonas pallii]MBV7255545.1 hypothetical protein [Pacificimonas pallii]